MAAERKGDPLDYAAAPTNGRGGWPLAARMGFLLAIGAALVAGLLLMFLRTK
jgi:hypothetical protein